MDIVEARIFNLKNSVFVEVLLFNGSVKIKHDDFIFTVNSEEINNIISDLFNLSVRDFFEFILNSFTNEYYLIEKTDNEFKIICAYIIQFNSKKISKRVELEFDYLPQEKDQITTMKKEIENLKKRITPTMEKIASISDREREEFYKEFTIKNISLISANSKRKTKECYFIDNDFRGNTTTLSSLNSDTVSDNIFRFKWNLLNSVTKILIVDDVDNYLKINI